MSTSNRSGLIQPSIWLENLAEAVDSVALLWRGRDNVIAIWREDAYRRRIFAHKFLFKRVFVVNDPQGIKQVLSTNHDNYRKSVYTERALKPLVGDGLFISHGELWKRQRRIATPAFHRSRLRGFAVDMVRTAREMIERWEAAGEGKELELTREMARVTMEVVSRAMFSDDLGAERAARVFHAFSRYQETLGRLDIVEMTGLPRWIPRWNARAAKDAVAGLDQVLHAIIEKRRAPGAERDDLLSLFMRARDPVTGATMSRSLLRDEAAVIILAGHETTANALCWTWYLLAKHPRVERQLHAEIDRVLGHREPTYDDLGALRYVRAIVDEAMRLYPPLHVYSREALSDDRIDGRHIPAGSMVVISPWLVHRHRELWDEPDEFRPERFLRENAAGRSRYAYIPFGAGPRTCLGSGFGLTEATLILTMIAQRFRLRLRPGHRVEPLGRLTLRPRFGLPMTLHRRARPSTLAA